MNIFFAAMAALAAASTPVPGPGEPDLDEVRAGAERFRDLNVALAEGYISPEPSCENAAGIGQPAARGAMGAHYFRPTLRCRWLINRR